MSRLICVIKTKVISCSKQSMDSQNWQQRHVYFKIPRKVTKWTQNTRISVCLHNAVSQSRQMTSFSVTFYDVIDALHHVALNQNLKTVFIWSVDVCFIYIEANFAIPLRSSCFVSFWFAICFSIYEFDPLSSIRTGDFSLSVKLSFVPLCHFILTTIIHFPKNLSCVLRQ